ncbi:DUF2849 domain-containing protein [Cucumibacter marinus]|uniref:DUF2849 domain-containing protein n=1 Tax=Cucumibacter marinus TaxID=1121252 RepID=UPI0003FA71C5|nr:DUF2849 domain-containing protein [Cucumibacter marinus]
MDIITANELLSGATVYLTVDGKWLEEVSKAQTFGPEDKAARDAAVEAANASGRYLSVEIEKAEIIDGRVVPTRLREKIRAEGPTSPRHTPQTLDTPHAKGEDSNVSL